MRIMKIILSLGQTKIFQKEKFRYMIAESLLIFGVFKMKKFFLALVCALFFVSNGFPQIVEPSPQPAEDEDIVKISTSLIQIDVSVTDKNGNIINDLKPEEIEIYENGKKQEISNFSFISNVRSKNEPIIEKNTSSQVLPSPAVRREKVRRTIALVVDDLTLSFQSMYYTRRALKKFVDEQMQEGDLVAIIRTGAGIGALQQFTTDKRQLYAAIEKVKYNPSGTGRIGAFAPLEALPPKIDNPLQSDEQEKENLDDQMAREAQFDDFRRSVFSIGTLGAVNYVVRGMQDLPGRKSIMLMSDGFKLFTKTDNGAIDSTLVLESLRRLVDQANRASVVIYTLDARGLLSAGISAEDDVGGRSTEQIEKSLIDRRNELFDTQEGLNYLAKQTGGISIINSNDLSRGVQRMLDDQSYYLVGYQPEEETFDAKTRRFNKLAVKIKRKGVRVRYRSGFFGITDEQIAMKPTTDLTPAQQITNALTSPFAVNDISVKLNALFGNEVKQGSFIRSFLHIKAQDLNFSEEADGSKKAVFDILAVAFGDNGLPVDEIGRTYTITFKENDFREVIKKGFVYDFRFPMKKAGGVQLRVALRDRVTGKLGSANQFVEVPNLKKERLTLSGIVLEDIPLKEWKRRNEMQPVSVTEKEYASDPLTATSLRQFTRGTVLNYGLQVYNAKLDNARKADLSFQINLFREGKLVYEGKPQAVDLQNQLDLQRLSVSGSLSLGTQMALGEYVMQLVVTDNLAKQKRKIATQFAQFEVIQ